MSPRTAFAAALASNLIFWPALFVFGALRPDYSHLTNAVSELGVWGAPRMWAWNVIGFIIPFWLAAFAGWGVGRMAAPERWLLPALLTAGGVLGGCAGVFPADMQDRQGFWTSAHLVCSQVGLIAWVIAMLALGVRVRGHARRLAFAALACLVVLIAAVVATYQPSHPGLSQRVIFAVFLGSHLVLAGVAMLGRLDRQNAMTSPPLA